MRPSIGRIVHYAAGSTMCTAAVVTGVAGTGEVHLCVLGPDGMSFQRSVREAGPVPNTVMYEPGTWHWPERVD